MRLVKSAKIATKNAIWKHKNQNDSIKIKFKAQSATENMKIINGQHKK